MTISGSIAGGRRGAGVAALGLCGAFFVTVAFALSLQDRKIFHGDLATDHRAVIGAAQFRNVGFRQLWFTQTEDGGPEIGLDPFYYSRHPSGGVVLLALAQMAGFSLPQARLIPLLFTSIGLFGFFLFFREATGRPWFGLLAAGALASLSPFWLLADSYQFYSYALFAKGLAFWLIAAGVNRSGTARLVRFAWAAAVVGFAISALGLETIPAIALLSVIYPLLLAEGSLARRIGTACRCGAWIGAGIVAGVGVHVLNVVPITDGGLEAVLEGYRLSLLGRSLDRANWVELPFPYPLEVLRRCLLYMPQVALVAGIGLVWFLVRKLRRDVSARWRHGRLLAACLLAEGLYFVVMQGHVREHVHTTVHLTTTMAVLGATALGAIVSGFTWGAVEAVVAGLAGAAVAIGIIVAPVQTFGNLVSPLAPGSYLRDDDHAIDSLARSVPRDSVVVVVTEPHDEWPVGYVLTRNGRTMVGCSSGRWSRPVSLAWTAGERTRRPCMALASDSIERDVRRELGRRGPVIAQAGRFRVHAMANFDASLVPQLPAPIPEDVVALARLVSPGPDVTSRAISYALFGHAGRGFWIHAPPKDVGARTVVRLAIPEELRPGRIRELAVPLRYDLNPAFRQPRLNVSVRIRTDEEETTRSSDVVIQPGNAAECKFAFEPLATLAELEIAVELAPGETENLAASVSIAEIRCVRR